MTVSKNGCRNHIEPENSSRPGDKSKFEKGIKVRRSYWSLEFLDRVKSGGVIGGSRGVVD